MDWTSKFTLAIALLLTVVLATQCTAPESTRQAPTTAPQEKTALSNEHISPASPQQEVMTGGQTPASSTARIRSIPATCFNSFRDGEETDVDCGGPCYPCAYGKQCMTTTDCAQDLSCDYRSKRCLQRKY